MCQIQPTKITKNHSKTRIVAARQIKFKIEVVCTMTQQVDNCSHAHSRSSTTSTAPLAPLEGGGAATIAAAAAQAEVVHRAAAWESRGCRAATATRQHARGNSLNVIKVHNLPCPEPKVVDLLWSPSCTDTHSIRNHLCLEIGEGTITHGENQLHNKAGINLITKSITQKS